MSPELVVNQGRVRLVVLAGDLGGRFLSGDFSVGVDGPAKCWVMTVAVRPHKNKSGTANPGPFKVAGQLQRSSPKGVSARRGQNKRVVVPRSRRAVRNFPLPRNSGFTGSIPPTDADPLPIPASFRAVDSAHQRTKASLATNPKVLSSMLAVWASRELMKSETSFIQHRTGFSDSPQIPVTNNQKGGQSM